MPTSARKPLGVSDNSRMWASALLNETDFCNRIELAVRQTRSDTFLNRDRETVKDQGADRLSRCAPKYLFSVVAARANGARTSVRRKVDSEGGLEILQHGPVV